MEPKISVIVPIYNVEKYLKQCLDSVLNQSLKEIEIILVDDGSTDKSKEIISDYENKCPNVISIRLQNKGVSVARNIGLKKATGKYVLYLDSDDFLEDECLDILYKTAEREKSNIIIFAHKEIYDTGISHKVSVINIEVDDKKVYSGIEVADMVLNCKFLGAAWNKLFNRECLIKNNFMFEPDRYVQDWYPIFIEISKADRISFINKPLYNYRIRENSITTKKTIKSIEDYSHAASQIIEYSQKHKLDSQSILIFKAITFNTIINRYYNYNLNIKNTNKMYSEIKRIVHYKHNLNNVEILKLKGLAFRTKLNILFWNIKKYNTFIKCNNIVRSIYKNIN